MKFNSESRRSTLAAAVFLMATSAIGPGFLTQTAVFTNQLGASFGFIILVSILFDIGAQMNIWRIVSVSGMRAQDLANKVLPGAGHLLTLMVTMGGLVFNIGNLAGAGLGLNVLTGLGVKEGAALSALIAIVLFLARDALGWMDAFAKLLGVVMIALTIYVVFASQPPVTEVMKKTLMPDIIDPNAILTLVGGTVGGYISFAGAHRLLESGISGEKSLPEVNRSSVSAILLASVMRVLLFLAAFGIVSRGIDLGSQNPAANVFKMAAGETGFRIFGVVMWSAAITSVVGSAYTSISFLKTLHPAFANRSKVLLLCFISFSAIIFLLTGQPVRVLLVAGAINGFILPFSLVIILLAIHNKKIAGSYSHPKWMMIAGSAVAVATFWMGIRTILSYIGL
jgi:Mn2+/Fe2+ NRAMP family transporter